MNYSQINKFKQGLFIMLYNSIILVNNLMQLLLLLLQMFQLLLAIILIKVYLAFNFAMKGLLILQLELIAVLLLVLNCVVLDLQNW